MRITINLIRFSRNGQAVLVGKTVEDRWNLLALGHSYIADKRALESLKKSEGEDFHFKVGRGTIQRLEWAGCLAMLDNRQGAWASFLRDWLNGWKGTDMDALAGTIHKLVA